MVKRRVMVLESNALVTGGAGFIGSNLILKLIEQGKNVTVLDNLSSGFLSNIPIHKNLKFINGDIRNIELVNELVKNNDVVFHLAEFIPNSSKYGAGHVIKFSVENPLIDFDVSAKGTLVVLDSVKQHNKRLIFTSTAAVYGLYNENISEDFKLKPISPYGVSKICAEQYIDLYNRIYDTHSTIFRLFNVYGPNQRKYVMYDTLIKLKNNPNSLELFGTGMEERDFIYINDVVDALIFASINDSAIGEVVNIGTGKATTIISLVKMIIKKMELDTELIFKGSSWKGDVSSLVSNNSKLLKLGYKPEVMLSKGLDFFINWFNKTGSIK
jgi:UDP-glucose 4-epimerase